MVPRFKLDLDILKSIFKTAQNSNSNARNGAKRAGTCFNPLKQCNTTVRGDKMQLESSSSPKKTFENILNSSFGGNIARDTQRKGF
jgi:hypothetical protein